LEFVHLRVRAKMERYTFIFVEPTGVEPVTS
jgi:hypothetical protein